MTLPALPQPAEPRRVLIVEDHPIFRRGLVQLISGEPGLAVAGEAAGVAKATELFIAEAPDLVLVDLSLADGEGVDLIRELKRRDPEVKLLVITSYAHTATADSALAAGAVEVLDKAAPAEVLLGAIRKALNNVGIDSSSE
jgi:DNA-binding NarL/FixJ family response regulator